MDESNDIKITDYQRVQEALKHYDTISIVSVEKDPPEQYVIEYRLRGYAYDADGSIRIAQKHQVQIDLPFGYPYFPPIVKPLTRIFHPDVAENAVRIADFWQDNTSLVDLIIYIGNMIRGEIFSTGHSFNQEAVDWYSEHGKKFPLDELRYIEEPEKKEVRQPQRSWAIPYKKILSVILIILVVGGGGLAYRDYHVLNGADRNYSEAEELLQMREFEKARTTADNALNSLKGIIFLSASQMALSEKIETFLNSQKMLEGFQGRVEYKGRFVDAQVADTLDQIDKLMLRAEQLKQVGSISEAVDTYEQAVLRARETGLDDVVSQIAGTSAMTRLDYYLAVANEAYAEKKWRKASEAYSEVVTILQRNKEAVSEESYEKLEKIDKLSLLATINEHKDEAVGAEKNDELKKSVAHHKTIVSLVRDGKYSTDPLLISAAEKAQKEIYRIEEQELVAESSEWLLENYKRLFKKHYPGVYGPGLQSPRARFNGYSGRNLVFILSCVELIQRRSNEFRLYYQYDPVEREWSIYYGN